MLLNKIIVREFIIKSYCTMEADYVNIIENLHKFAIKAEYEIKFRPSALTSC